MTNDPLYKMYFDAKVKGESVTDDGTIKEITRMYVVHGISFADAENKVMEYTLPENMCVTHLKIRPYVEIFHSDEPEGDTPKKYFVHKIGFITITETFKQKLSKSLYLVKANNIDESKNVINDRLKDTILDWRLLNISETDILDEII